MEPVSWSPNVWCGRPLQGCALCSSRDTFQNMEIVLCCYVGAEERTHRHHKARMDISVNEWPKRANECSECEMHPC
ncbi:hypothetical protein GJAV_G00206610 [Gymnothorax javanicus]|nr:hypothetical protein GJAV_G00206610 [Gymnothorax javanicus]